MRKLMNIKWFAWICLLVFGCQPPAEHIKVSVLTCDDEVEPLGIDSADPLLGWQMRSGENGIEQAAYQIIVSDRKETLDKGIGDIWNSGKITSSQSQHIKYEGPAFVSGKYYYWKVRVWDQHLRPSEWSKTSFWCTGMLSENDWKGYWIAARFSEVSAKRTAFRNWARVATVSPDTAAVYLRKEININKKVSQAIAFISGLGYYELFLNGQKSGTRVLDPAFTDYQKMVGYATYDVTAALRRGKNALGVILGNGFYNLPGNDLFQMEKANWKTPPKLIVNILLRYDDGALETIVSDSSWKWSFGEITYNDIRGGETINHTKQQRNWAHSGFDDSGWNGVVKVPSPVGELKSQRTTPIRVNEVIRAEKIIESGNNSYTIDFGKNITGWISLTTEGRKNQHIRCLYSEVINENGAVDTKHASGHTGGRFQRDEFILDGTGNEYFEPRFTYHGFRYVQISGVTQKPSIGDVLAKSIHTSLDTIGGFSCSDEHINNLQLAVQRTLLNSIHGMPGEEPTREKMGWTLDAGVTMESYLYNFDAVRVYKKALQDFIDAQEPSGHIPPIVPTNGWGHLSENGQMQERFDDPWWGGTIFFIADKLFEYTGDSGIIKYAFDAAKSYVDYVSSTAKGDLVYWSLGDWLDMTQVSEKWGPGLTPIVQTSSAYYWWMTNRIATYADWLGKKELSAQYSSKAEKIKEKFNASFLDQKTGWYAENSQTAQVVPLYLGIVPEEMKKKVEEKLSAAIRNNNYHVSTGFVGVLPFLNYLSANTHIDTVFRVFGQKSSPGWLHMVADAKSTLGENLNSKGYGTGHHPFGAHVGSWLFKYPGGIRIDAQRPGFKEFLIEPQFAERLQWVKCYTHSLYGRIVSNWTRTPDGIILKIEIPVNSKASVILPAQYFNKISFRNSDGVKVPSPEKIDDAKVRLTLPSGIYELLLGK